MVKSVAGRDGGSYAFVVGEPEPGYVLIADGRIRKVENPKRKNVRHVADTGLRMRRGLMTKRSPTECYGSLFPSIQGIRLTRRNSSG